MKKVWLAFAILALCARLQGAQAEDVSLKLPNGLTALGSLDLTDGKTLQDGPLVLFIHGTLAHKDMSIVSAQRSLLNEAGINVLAPNLTLGLDKRSGMYDCATPHTHRHIDALDEIDAWLAWLQQQGVKSVTLMGHSRGGNQVAWYAVQSQNPMVEKLVLVAPQTWSADKIAQGYAKRYKQDLASLYKTMKQKVDNGQGDEIVSNIDFIYCANTGVSAKSFVDYYAENEKMDTPHLLAGISVPVLVIAGSKDTVVDDLPQKMAKIDQPNVSFVTVEDADHLFIDFAGEDLADQVVNFVNAQE